MTCRLILFDVDGVLLDSLGSHLRFCRDWASREGLSVAVPDAAAFKALVRRGVPVSPMDAFFAAVGFPATHVAEAVVAYESAFLPAYAPAVFPDVKAVLSALHAQGHVLGLVTANVRKNVAPALGDAFSLFRRDCVFTFDDVVWRGDKAVALTEALARAQVSADEALFVGDQPADERAAGRTGVRFVAAAYGWGFDEQPGRLPHLGALPALLAEIAPPSSRRGKGVAEDVV